MIPTHTKNYKLPVDSHTLGRTRTGKAYNLRLVGATSYPAKLGENRQLLNISLKKICYYSFPNVVRRGHLFFIQKSGMMRFVRLSESEIRLQGAFQPKSPTGNSEIPTSKFKWNVKTNGEVVKCAYSLIFNYVA